VSLTACDEHDSKTFLSYSGEGCRTGDYLGEGCRDCLRADLDACYDYAAAKTYISLSSILVVPASSCATSEVIREVQRYLEVDVFFLGLPLFLGVATRQTFLLATCFPHFRGLPVFFFTGSNTFAAGGVISTTGFCFPKLSLIKGKGLDSLILRRGFPHRGSSILYGALSLLLLLSLLGQLLLFFLFLPSLDNISSQEVLGLPGR
jgi:hypothetical protein